LWFHFIGNGTDGSDDLESGIHLRWRYPTELGPPPDGVVLTRCSTPVKTGIISLLIGYSGADNIPENILPLVTGEWSRLLYYTIPCMSSRVEISFDLQPDSDIYIQLYDGETVYEPWHLFNQPSGLKSFPFVSEKISAVFIYGNGVTITQLTYSCCADDVQWERVVLINKNDLPADLLAAELALYYGVSDEDYAVVLGRLGATASERPMPETDWAELSPVVDQVALVDGVSVPAGWSRPEDMTTTDENLPEVVISSADLLNLSMLDYKMARAMGTAFVDTFPVSEPYNLFQYQIEAEYPARHMANLKKQFTFDEFAVTDHQYTDIAFGEVLLKDLYLPSVNPAATSTFRTNNGLSYTNDPFGDTHILFGNGIKEVQLFVGFSSSTLSVNAMMSHGHGLRSSSKVYTGTEAIIKLSGERIESIRLEGEGIVLYRVHYDKRRLSNIKLIAKLCGLRVEPPLELYPPENLVADQIPVPPLFDESKTMTTRYLAGLRWKAWLNPDLKQVPQAPVAYNIFSGAGNDPMTPANTKPVYLTQSLHKPYTPPEGWPERRPRYLDALNDPGTYNYEVTSLDIWGRQSEPSEEASMTILVPIPPPPVNLKAKFLDYSTIQPDNSSIDPNLRKDEIDWLLANKIDALHLTWLWTEVQETICPFADHFNIHFEYGWLNLFKGVVTTETVTETVPNTTALGLTAADLEKYPVLDGVASFETYRFTVALENPITENGFAMCMMKQGNLGFLVLKNTSGTEPEIWVIIPDALAGGEVILHKKITIILVPRSNDFVNYKDAGSWTDLSITATVNFSDCTTDADGNRNYELYIGSPAFPSPAFVPNETSPVRYGQLAASTVNTDGIEGAVGAPATVMAVNRKAPDTLDKDSIDYGTAMAKPPDVHGKSTYYYRWLKQSNGLKYFVYRAVDDTIIRTDHGLLRPKSEYEALADAYGIAYTEDTFKLTKLSDYEKLDSNQLYVIANLAGNEAAFTRMTQEAIADDDDAYENRITEAPAIGISLPATDSSYLLFEDNDLEGMGDNYYFYRIRTVDTAGNLSAYSPTTIPIEIPQVVPAVKPVITSISGEEKQIRIKWTQKSHASLLGWNLYRTGSAEKAGDWRRMELLKTNSADPYSVSMGNSMEFIDTGVAVRTPYFYGLIALTSDSDSNEVKSEMSPVVTVQAWDLSSPPIPELFDPVWDSSSNTIQLAWNSAESLTSVVQRSSGSGGFIDVSDNLLYSSVDGTTGIYMFNWNDEEIDSGQTFTYRILVRNDIGKTAISSEKKINI